MTHHTASTYTNGATSPEKARLFRVAQLTPEAMEFVPQPVKHDGFVNVEFFNVTYNFRFHTPENLFAVYSEEEFLGHFFERALSNFLL
jgi:hypothetical protein